MATRPPWPRRGRPRHERTVFRSRVVRGGPEQLEERLLLSVSSIELVEPTGVSGTTGEKPQSKVWKHDGVWWGVWSIYNGTYLHRLDGSAWTRVLQLSSVTSARADVKPDGDVTHVLLHRDESLQLSSLEYVPGSPPTYQPWSGRQTLSSVTLPSDAEAVTIDIDSQDRMWLAYDNGTTIEVRYSDAPYTSWSRPIVLASNVNDDDIAVVTALPGKIGVLWSNQTTQRFGFRTHADGAAPDVWSSDEVPASQSARSIRGGMADDHLNVAVASDGTLYAAVKTSYDTAGETQLALLVRRPDGVWDDMYEVDTVGTRPIVQLNDAADTLLYTYRIDAAEPIVYRECSTVTLICTPREILMAESSLNNASSTKQNFTGDLVVIASTDKGKLHAARMRFDASPNQPPSVYAGADQTISLASSAILDASVSDDGLPNPPAAVTTQWSAVSGPGTVSFADASAVDTTASFSDEGTYVLRLTANDGEWTSFDETSITVVSDSGGPVTVSFQNGVSPSASYGGTEDATIKSDSPTGNFGIASTLEMDGSPDVAALVKWDVSSIPAGASVTSASLTLHVPNASPYTYKIYEVKRPWVESDVTWSQSAAGAAWEIAGALGATDRGSTVLGEATFTSTGIGTLHLNTAGLAVVQGWVNDPSTNHGLIFQEYSDANSNRLYFSSSEISALADRPALTVSYTTGEPGNAAPLVDAGADQSIPFGSDVFLDGTVNDDGLPNPPGAVTTQWTKVSGPGTVTFANAAAIDTTASFSQTGTYVLRLAANDGELTAFDEVSIAVTSDSEPVTVSFQDGVSPSTGYFGTRDTKIKSDAAATNFGADATLEVDGSPDYASLVQWDIGAIPAGSAVESASITLNVTGRTDDIYEIYALRRAWVESEATWSAYAAGAAWESPGAQGPGDRGSAVLGTVTSPSTGIVTIPLNADGVALVQAWVDNPSANFGVIFQDYVSADNGLDFDSREASAAARRPMLTVTYAAATTQSTSLLAAEGEGETWIEDAQPLSSTSSTEPATDDSTAGFLPLNAHSSALSLPAANDATFASSDESENFASEPTLLDAPAESHWLGGGLPSSDQKPRESHYAIDSFDLLEDAVDGGLWTDLAGSLSGI